MQKYRLIQLLILFILCTVVWAAGQEPDYHQLYITGQIATLEQLLSDQQIKSPDWKKFVAALFEENFDQAFKTYIEIYHQNTDIQLRSVVIDRISQYYYAKGLYESAERLLIDEKFRNQIFSVETDKIYFGIQLGAFSSKANAEKARLDFMKTLSELTIVKKISGGKELYIVVAGKFQNKEAAEDYKNQLRKKYGYKGMVIQF